MASHTGHGARLRTAFHKNFLTIQRLGVIHQQKQRATYQHSLQSFHHDSVFIVMS
jgi:hypothetical protein